MTKFYKILFFNSTILGSLISISSSSWLMIWIGLEINLLSIMPLLKTKNFYSSEASIKYFITQATASILFLFSICMMSNLKSLNFNNLFYISIFMNSSLLMKLGAAPFHFWFPEVISGLDWPMILMLTTWQKLAPFILISYLMNSSLFISMSIILSSMISGLQGLNQTSMKKIMAYSSINHVSWMLACILNSLTIWLIYFIIYTLINMNIMIMLNMFNINHLPQLNKILNNKKFKMSFMINFLSLGGLPPFLGFLPKWLSVFFLIKNEYFILTFLMIIFSLLLMFMYIRIIFSSLSFNSEESLTITFNVLLFKPSLLNLMLNLGLMFCFIIYSSI